ncbi:MAG: hypothetical protein IKA64_03440 [Clostridia bacterium]|nr:hypothetical protein [Clostridia bacterium]
MKNENKRIYMLAPEGNLYKTNLHCHTTVSDGKFTPEEIKKLYMERGYSAVAFTDHKVCRPHPELTDASFVALTGVEIAFGIGRSTSVHICGIARDPLATLEIPNEPMDDMEKINAGIRRLNELDFITTLNHPRWSGMSYADVTEIGEVGNIEVANGFEMIQDGYGTSDAIYELELRRGRRAYPLATDDSHRATADGGAGPEYFHGFTVIRAEELTYGALISALDSGSFYASTGPLFHELWIEGGVLHVECSAVSGVYVHGELYSHRAAVVESEDKLTRVDINVEKILAGSKFLFVIISDKSGGRAFSAPIWL